MDRGEAKDKVRWHFPGHDEVCQLLGTTSGFGVKENQTSTEHFVRSGPRSTQTVMLPNRGGLVLGSLIRDRGLQYLANSGKQRNLYKFALFSNAGCKRHKT